MLIVVILCAFGSALFNAVAADPQRQDLFRKDFIKYMTLNRWWLFGPGLQAGAFAFQATALKFGSLVEVEPILTIDLVFIVLILNRIFKLDVGFREWFAVAAICIGLGGFFFSAQPTIGHKQFVAVPWLIATVVMLVIITVSIYLVRRNDSPNQRALISGLATGISFSLVAMFTKLATEEISHGFIYLISHWQVYALLISGIIGLLMTQNTYGAGPVGASQPALEIPELPVSVLMGIILFGDSLKISTLALVVELICGAITIVGIWTLATSNKLYIKNEFRPYKKT